MGPKAHRWRWSYSCRKTTRNHCDAQKDRERILWDTEEGGVSGGLEHKGEVALHLTRGCGQMPNTRMERWYQVMVIVLIRTRRDKALKTLDGS